MMTSARAGIDAMRYIVIMIQRSWYSIPVRIEYNIYIDKYIISHHFCQIKQFILYACEIAYNQLDFIVELNSLIFTTLENSQ
jgi:hypothetical protein